MNLKDIITLAKAGFSSSDIKELINTPEPAEPEQKEPETDYKKLYEESEQKLNEVKESLSKLQQDNNQKDSSTEDDSKSAIDVLADLLR